ncbi:MAG: Fe-S protein assembly co-chaperone HscB [Pseudomonadota bacterium]
MSKNYFQLLGLTTDFEVDRDTLTTNYRDLQRQFHPDKFASRSDMEKRLSVQHSALINDAFQTLKNPLKRAIYHLSLLGLELKDHETTMDPLFLMQQMQLREQLEQVKEQPEPYPDLEKMQADVAKKLSLYIKDLITLFVSTNQKNDSVDHEILEKIKNIILKMQFLNKLQQQCEELEEDLSNQL